jgi:hypothetical protein
MKLPDLHPIDAEQRFTDVFSRLKKTVQTSPNADEKIATFWDADWQRAPFEEELTLRQLASLTVDTLTKKKSFNTEKMIALALALERGLGDGKKTLSLVTNNHTESDKNLFYKADFTESVETIIYFYGRQKLAQEVFKGTQFEKFFTSVFGAISRKDIQDPWATESKIKDEKVILQYAQDTIPEVLIHFRTALTGPGTSTKHLLLSYNIAQETLAAAEELILPLLFSIKAKQVVINKKIIPSHYSLHPESSATIFKALKGHTIKSKEKFKDTFSLPFPFFDVELIFRIVKK